jgi:circadian clock protein KaiB
MSRPPAFKFRLYVAGDAQNSAQATANLAAICEAHLVGRHEIEVVDVFQQPGRALDDRVFMTPTLLKYSPLPARRIIGTLSEVDPVLAALGLHPRPE